MISQGRSLRMQALEPRQMMAGDVVVRFDGDVLAITGDQFPNDVAVATSSGGDVTITPRGSTTVNGVSNPLRVRQLNRSRAVEIDLGGGDDLLELTTIERWGRKDPTMLQFNVDSGTGADQITIDGFHSYFGLSIDMGTTSRWTSDAVQITDSDIAILQVTSVGGNYNADIESVDANYLSIKRVGRLEIVDVEVGARPENLQYPFSNEVPYEDSPYVLELISVYQTEGWGVVDIQGFSKLSSRLDIGSDYSLGPDSDLFGQNVEIQSFHNARILSGSGGYWKASSIDSLNAEGLEPSTLVLSNVHHLDLADTNVGQLHIKSSPNVNLNDVSTRKSLTIVGSSQYNDIFIEDSHIGRDLNITTAATKDTIFLVNSAVSDDAFFDTGAGNDHLVLSDLTVRDSLFADLGEGRDTLEIDYSSARRVWLDGGSDISGKKQPRDRLSLADNSFSTKLGRPVYRNWEGIEKY